MITINRKSYTLLLGNNPCEIFTYYDMEEFHGLNYSDCVLHHNTKDSAYIFGWANFVPKNDDIYHFSEPRYVFINLQRCGDNYETYGGVFHELMHHSLHLHKYNMDLEEQIITWAENETKEVFQFVLENL